MIITLSKRLSALVDMIPTCTTLYDIGCDHGYTSITAIQRKVCKKAYACDVRKGPLMAAEKHIKEMELEGCIQCVLSDGLKEISQVSKQSCVLISGMGGDLMSSILAEALAAGRLQEDTILVLQPQSELGEFRKFLYKNGMKILDEDMVYEEGKYYPMMKVGFGDREDLLGIEYEYGPILLAQKNQVLKQFLLWKKELTSDVLNKLTNTEKTDRIERKISEVSQELQRIEAVLSDVWE